MNITAQKWGNSFAVRIPKHIVKKTNISLGTPLIIDINSKGNIEITPPSKKEKLQKYLEKITDKNLHGEIESTEFSSESW